MSKASACIACKKIIVPSRPPLEDFSHYGYCYECAKNVARNTLSALIYYDSDSGDAKDLFVIFEGYIKQNGANRRSTEQKNITYPEYDDQSVGILVAISRIYAPDTIDQLKEVLDKHNKLIFGKFRYKRQKLNAPHVQLANLGKERYEGKAVEFIKDRLSSRLRDNKPIDLFILDPDPPISLWRARVVDFYFTSMIGRKNEADFSIPVFKEVNVIELIPEYYWLSSLKEDLKYHCNYWFLIDSLYEIDPKLALESMTDLETGKRITLATAQLYPAEVSLPKVAIKPPLTDETRISTSQGRTILMRSLLNALDNVKLTTHAVKDLEDSPEDMLRQALKYLVITQILDQNCTGILRVLGIYPDSCDYSGTPVP